MKEDYEEFSNVQYNKFNFNRATRELKDIIHKAKNEIFQEYVQGLSATVDINYSLWKVTLSMKQAVQYLPPLK